MLLKLLVDMKSEDIDMQFDNVLNIGMIILMGIVLLIFVPKQRIREAIVIFFFKECLTWLIGLIVVECRLIEYPVRLFSYASRTSFAFEYFVLPAICVVYLLYYPKAKSLLKQFLYINIYAVPITAFEVFCLKYTHLIKYIHWTWYITYITLVVTAIIARLFYIWFFKTKTIKAG